jgi:hypothetical protein
VYGRPSADQAGGLTGPTRSPVCQRPRSPAPAPVLAPHLAILLHEADGSADADQLHLLLAALSADLVHALRADGHDWDRIRAGVLDLAARVLPGSEHG